MTQTERTASQIGTLAVAAFLLLITQVQVAFSQSTDSTSTPYHFGGAVTVTNNGVSLLPTFTLGKPAAMFDLKVGSKKLSFEPQFRFSLEGKPWTFLFWWRYKLVQTEKLKLNVGAHPAFAFRPVSIVKDGEIQDALQAQRYLAGEFSPSYYVSKNFSVGMYYLYSHGFAESATTNTHFVALRSNFSNIKLFDKFYMKFNPQVYYLKLDKNHGYYATATLTLAKRNFPITLESILNHSIKTSIVAKSDFVWNVSLIYTFNREYVRK